MHGRNILECVGVCLLECSRNIFTLSINIYFISASAVLLENKTFIMSLLITSTSHILQSLSPFHSQTHLLASHFSADTKEPRIATSTQGECALQLQ